MPLPDMYSMELSLFVLEAGLQAAGATSGPDLMYLSLTDYIQHKYAPGEPEANAFYPGLDAMFARLDALGAVVALTADHGMNDKSKPDGSPNVIWLQDHLDRSSAPGDTIVICPITDALCRAPRRPRAASFGSVAATAQSGGCHAARRRLPGIEAVLEKEDRRAASSCRSTAKGTSCVIGRRGTCIGGAEADARSVRPRRTPAAHPWGRVRGPVPFIFNRPLTRVYAERAAAEGLKSADFRFCPQRPRGRLDGIGVSAPCRSRQQATNLMRTAKAAVCEAPNTPFVIKEYPLRPVRPREVLVRVRMSTICRSDIHSYQGRRPNPCPGVLGHEIIGEIAALGRGSRCDMRGERACPGRPRHLERVLHSAAPATSRGPWTCRRSRPGWTSTGTWPRTRRPALTTAALASTATSCPGSWILKLPG